ALNRHPRFPSPFSVFCYRARSRSSARIEQQPSKLWVAGSNPAGIASTLYTEPTSPKPTKTPPALCAVLGSLVLGLRLACRGSVKQFNVDYKTAELRWPSPPLRDASQCTARDVRQDCMLVGIHTPLEGARHCQRCRRVRLRDRAARQSRAGHHRASSNGQD